MILEVIYLEDGYFNVKYSTSIVVQDLKSIKLTVPTDPSIKTIYLFLRNIKLNKLKDENFDDIEYRDKVIYKKNNNNNLDDLDLLFF